MKDANSPSISICLATYNRVEYLKLQLDSFVKQSQLPSEIVIVDDCSQDSTYEYLTSFSESAPFEVRIHRNTKNLGYGASFMKSLSMAEGDYIFFADDDDVWFERKIERMLLNASENPDAWALMNDAYITDEHLRKSGLTKIEQLLESGATEDDFVMGCVSVIRRELKDLCLPFPDGLRAHDSWILRVASSVGRKRVIREALQLYRRHSSNVSKGRSNSVEFENNLHYWWKYLTAARYLRSEADQDYLCRLEALSRGLESISSKVRDSDMAHFNNYMADLRASRELMQARIEIRQSWIFGRIFGALRFYSKGRYGSRSFYKMARDMVG